MKAVTVILSLLAASACTLAVPVEQAAGQTVSVSYDPVYDAGGRSLTTVSCSNGINGLMSRGYSAFDTLPNFPMIGGSPIVAGWNSPNCGKCYKLHYKAGRVDRSIHMLAIDAAPGGFNLATKAVDELTDGMVKELGRVQATYLEVEASKCGF